MEKLNSNIIIDPKTIADEMVRSYDYQGDDFKFSEVHMLIVLNNLYNLEREVRNAIED